MKWDAVIPAGGTIDTAYAKAIGSQHRALAPFGRDHKPLLQHIVDALRGSGKIRRIICVAPEAIFPRIDGVDLWKPAGGSGPDNIRAGLAEADPSAQALICTSDLPFLTPESVRDFLNACCRDAEIAVGVVGAEDYLWVFRDAPPSEFVRLSDAGQVTLGGLFLVRPELLTRQEKLFQQIFAGRKDQWRMAGLLGPRLLWQFATKTLCLRDIVSRAEGLLGGTVQVIPNTKPSLAYDIDTLDDYTYARTYFTEFHE